MLDYGSKGYWQKYYHDSVVKGQIYAEEWLCSKEELSSFLAKLLTPRTCILITGCGMSQLGEKIYDQNECRDITCLDWSDDVVKYKAKKNSRARDGMQYHLADMMEKISFSHFGFDVVLDKGMFDCVMCRRDARTASQAVIRNAAAMLRPEGKYVIVSSAAPDERLPLFTSVNSPTWASVQVYHAPKATLSDARAGNLPDGELIKTEWLKEPSPEDPMTWRLHDDHIFLYVLQKERGRSLEEELAIFEGIDAVAPSAEYGSLEAD